MPRNDKRAPRRKKRRMSRQTRSLILWLLFCFPAGLTKMWSRYCAWPRAVKCIISTFYLALLVALLLPQTMPPDRTAGGVRIIRPEPTEDAAGPSKDETSDNYEVYVPMYVPDVSLLVAPTPTPVPIYVYCNDGGRYYHSENCRYTKKTTPRVTLSQALNAGFKQCPDCNAPDENGAYRSDP